MICTKCGGENEDSERFCQACGHKLQSEASDPSLQSDGPGGRDRDRGGLLPLRGGQTGPAGLGRYLEAWAYALALIALGFALIRLDLAWLLYLIVPLAAWVLRLRGL